MSILASHHAKWNYQINTDWQTYLAGDPSGKAYRCDLYWLARFWNRWGKVQAIDPDRFFIVRYEELRADTAGILRQVAKHWGLQFSDDVIEAAVLAGTKSAMADKTDPDGEPNVLQRRRDTTSDLFTGEAFDIYRNHVETLFDYSLGYDFMTPPD